MRGARRKAQGQDFSHNLGEGMDEANGAVVPHLLGAIFLGDEHDVGRIEPMHIFGM